MRDTDAASLVTAASPTLRDALAFPIEDYGARFVDVAFWRPYVALIAEAHDLSAGEIGMGEPGTFPTFILDRSHVVKLFGAPFDGPRCWAVERDVARLLGDADLAIPIPAVIAAGALARDPDWRYLVTAFVPGEPFATALPKLDAAERGDAAAALGRMIRRVHDLAIPAGTALGAGWGGCTAFIDGQRRGVAERHRRWGALPDRLLGEIDAYVAGYRVPDALPPSLVHADLHGHHLIGEPSEPGWAMRGVIDWGDARLGDRFSELPALHLGLFGGDRAMLGAFLEAYGWPDFRAGAFVRRAMAMTLLHEFNALEKVATFTDLPAIASLDDLAEALWRV
jgi:aminoglycoside phosphotransferase (APT) family kinase protein